MTDPITEVLGVAHAFGGTVNRIASPSSKTF